VQGGLGRRSTVGAGKDLVKETWRQVAPQIVGQVIGHAVKAFAGPTVG